MQISQRGIDLIKSFEGYMTRLPDGSCRAYWDADGGVWTIGWGCTEGVKKGDVWTRKQAESRFADEMRKHFTFVEQQAPWANQNEFDALASFSYNGGPGMLRQLLRRYPDKQELADAFLKFDHAGGRKLRGLTRRRRAERELFLTPPAKPTIFKRLSEKRAVKKAEVKETIKDSLWLRIGRFYTELCKYLGITWAGIMSFLQSARDLLFDPRTLAAIAVLGTAYAVAKGFEMAAVKKRRKLVIPAADGPKTKTKRKAA